MTTTGCRLNYPPKTCRESLWIWEYLPLRHLIRITGLNGAVSLIKTTLSVNLKTHKAGPISAHLLSLKLNSEVWEELLVRSCKILTQLRASCHPSSQLNSLSRLTMDLHSRLNPRECLPTTNLMVSSSSLLRYQLRPQRLTQLSSTTSWKR
jgi:hypothetical protein